jgi:hypothetical protein
MGWLSEGCAIMSDLYLHPNKKVAVLVLTKGVHGGIKSYKIVDAVVESVGTKYAYLKYDQQNLGGFKGGRPKFYKKTGRQTDRNELYVRIIFNEREDVEKYILDLHRGNLRFAIEHRMRHCNHTNEQLLKALEALGGEDPGAF